MASTFGLYFKGLGQRDANAMRRRLNKIAASYGYRSERGPTNGEGNAAEMLVAIDGGELATVLLPDEQRSAVIAWIESNADSLSNLTAGDGLKSIARQLQAAIEREKEAEEEVHELSLKWVEGKESEGK